MTSPVPEGKLSWCMANAVLLVDRILGFEIEEFGSWQHRILDCHATVMKLDLAHIKSGSYVLPLQDKCVHGKECCIVLLLERLACI